MARALEPNYLQQKLDQCPPWLVRLMAIVPGRGGRKARRIPEAEIIRRSGLSRRTVIRLSYSQSWGSLTLATTSRFAAACGVNLLGRNPTFHFFRSHSRGDCDYLTKAQKRALERLRQERELSPR